MQILEENKANVIKQSASANCDTNARAALETTSWQKDAKRADLFCPLAGSANSNLKLPPFTVICNARTTITQSAHRTLNLLMLSRNARQLKNFGLRYFCP